MWLRGRAKGVVAGRVHLVLPDVAHDDRLAAARPAEGVHRLAHPDLGRGSAQLGVDHRLALERVVFPETLEPGGPAAAVPGRGADPGGEDGEGRARIRDDGNFGGYRLADLGSVDVDVDDPRVAGVGVEVPGHPVVEAHADREDHVRLVGEHVGAVVAVHAEKTDVERVVRGQGGEAEEGEADREPAALRHFAELRLRPGESDPMSGEDIGALGAVEETGGRLALRDEGRGGPDRPWGTLLPAAASDPLLASPRPRPRQHRERGRAPRRGTAPARASRASGRRQGGGPGAEPAARGAAPGPGRSGRRG